MFINYLWQFTGHLRQFMFNENEDNTAIWVIINHEWTLIFTNKQVATPLLAAMPSVFVRRQAQAKRVRIREN